MLTGLYLKATCGCISGTFWGFLLAGEWISEFAGILEVECASVGFSIDAAFWSDAIFVGMLSFFPVFLHL